MERLMKSILVSGLHRALRALGKVLFIPAALAVGVAPGSAMGSTIPAPVVSITTLDAAQAPLIWEPRFTWRTDGRPLEFVANVTRYESSPVDVYFGILLPGGRIASWHPGTGHGPILQEGFWPAARRTAATEMSGAALLRGNPRHSFSADSAYFPLGLYSVFIFLVPAGADPRDPSRWYGATMSPLVITN